MTLRKLEDAPLLGERQERECRDPGHEVPSMIVLDPGTWEHTCPGCGRKVVFTVNRPTW